MHSGTRRDADALLTRLAWWTLLLICVLYGAFALATGVAELLYLFGIAPEAKHRATPLVFVVHALSGAVVLLIGPLQFNRRIRRRVRLHRALGRTYVVAVWLASAAAVVDVRSFDVSTTAKVVFAAIATLWFTASTIGMLRARARRFAEHREWMLRSFSLSFFFVTGSLWVPALASTPLPPGVAYPLALFLSGALNLAAAELWIHYTRARAPATLVPTPVLAADAISE